MICVLCLAVAVPSDANWQYLSCSWLALTCSSTAGSLTAPAFTSPSSTQKSAPSALSDRRACPAPHPPGEPQGQALIPATPRPSPRTPWARSFWRFAAFSAASSKYRWLRRRPSSSAASAAPSSRCSTSWPAAPGPRTAGWSFSNTTRRTAASRTKRSGRMRGMPGRTSSPATSSSSTQQAGPSPPGDPTGGTTL